MKLKITLLFLSLWCTSSIFSQLKSNQVGIFVSPGTYFVTGPNFLGNPKLNYSIGFGGIYQRGLSDHFNYRITVGGMFEMSSTKFENQSLEKISYRTFFFELIPFHIQYVFNPDNKLKAYIGLSAGVRKSNRTTSTVYQNGGSESSVISKNQPFEFIPSASIGLNYQVDGFLSLFLQPEYRVAGLHKFSNSVLHGINVQVGLLYGL